MTMETQDPAAHETPAGRTRDALATRRLLLQAARHRFARDGYGATTVRDIAADAGVNVALINRYFTSKEGLFEACLQHAVEELDRPDPAAVTPEDLLRALVSNVAATTGDEPLQALLLLRSSGDERAEQIRRGTLHAYTERMAAVAGWRKDDPSTDQLLLGAQIAMALGFGILVMRTSAELEPLASATEAELIVPMRAVLDVLLRAR